MIKLLSAVIAYQLYHGEINLVSNLSKFHSSAGVLGGSHITSLSRKILIEIVFKSSFNFQKW